MRRLLLTATFALALVGCAKDRGQACAQVATALVVHDDDAFRQQCYADLAECDPAHADDNPPLFNCLGSARTREDVRACMSICTNRRFHGRSFRAFGTRLP